jgi:hypothetical protein
MQKEFPSRPREEKGKNVTTSCISRFTDLNQSCGTCVHDVGCIFDVASTGGIRVQKNRRYFRRNFVEIMHGCPKYEGAA